ncbi:uncharacterized protein DSM5745_09109 [Aspergillus mulundensis]|uniref:BZIP domain-containing protein n=1 Tax=Aspergillus mulundensis TaxID=1810919 RepID=A0A3D8QZK6_9EURO|nr:hypothetical protein DSM5745_09109 [Aspergillus mulundensis]RDW67243.1 hypothetical protein DSM5745_09109 [Aspergillus mulundensis]
MFEYYTAFADASLALAMPKSTPDSPQTTDEETPSHTPSPLPSPSAGATQQQPKPKPGRRGRPKILDSNGEEVASKERRKAQVRQAQRAYRSRKEEQTAVLLKRVTELEQKLRLARDLYLSTHDAVMTSGVSFLLNDSRLKLLHDNLQLLVANTAVSVGQDPTGSLLDLNALALATAGPGGQPLALGPHMDNIDMDMLLGHGHGQDIQPAFNLDGSFDMVF